MTQSRDVDIVLLSSVLIAVPLVYWSGLKDYTLGPKLLVWQVPLLALSVLHLSRGACFPRHPIILAAAGYLLLNACSLFWARDAVLALVELSKIATGVGFLCVVAAQPASQLPRLIKALASVGLCVAAVGILQHMNVLPWRIPSAGMPSSTLGFRNIAAMFVIQTLPFVIWLIWTRTANIWLWFASSTLLTGFLIHTRTRGAWIGLLAAATFAMVLNWREVLNFSRNHRQVVFALIAGLLIGIVPGRMEKIGPQSIDEKKATVADATASILTPGGDRGRITLWSRTLEMISANPTGVGLGNWATEYPAYDDRNLITYSSAPYRPHNDWLWIAAEIGWLGAVAFGALIFITFRMGIRAQLPNEMKGLLIAAQCSVVAILVHSSFSFPRERITPTLLLWFSLGVIAALTPKKNRMLPVDRVTWALVAAGVVCTGVLTARVIAFEAAMHAALLPERRGDWQEVEKHAARALEAGRFHPEAILLKGYAANQLRRYQESVDHYETYARVRPYDVQFLNGYAIALQQTDQLEKAREMFDRARALVADSSDLDYNLAMLLIRQQKPADAIPVLENVIRREGTAADLLFHLGNAHALAGNDTEAVEILESVLRVDATLLQAHFVLGELHLRQGRTAASRTAFETFLKGTHTSNPYTKRANQVLQQLSQRPQRETPSNE